MKFRIIVLVLITASVLVNKLKAQEFLRPYKWKNRVIILIAESTDNALFIEQKHKLQAASPDLEERDLVILTNHDTTISLKTKKDIVSSFPPKQTGFRFILIGKDNTVKKDSDRPVDMKELFALIDSMPMRQREMRERDQ
jgi:hypothetical protein